MKKQNSFRKNYNLFIVILVIIGIITTISVAYYSSHTTQQNNANAESIAQTQSYTVADSSDVANQQGARVRLGGTASRDSDILFDENWIGNYTGRESYVGILFTGTPIPKGSIVKSATLTITSSRNDSESLRTITYAENSIYPQTFSVTDGPASRMLTQTNVQYKKAIKMMKNQQYTFDVTAPVNELIQNLGASGRIVLIIKGVGSAYDWERFYNNAGNVPMLTITYQVPSTYPTISLVKPTPVSIVSQAPAKKSPTATPKPQPTQQPVSGGTGTSGKWWRPGVGVLPWQWEIDHEISTSNANDMGTNSLTPSGSKSLTPVVYDIDGINNTASDVNNLHAMGKKVICYVEVGSAGDYYGNDDGSTSYYAELKAAGDLGAKMQGYPEYYLNSNAASTISIIEKMIHDQCYQKGFDGVEPDLDDSYTDNTGFTISEANEVSYLATLSKYAHSLGLAWGLKNGGDGGTPTTFIPNMVPYIDFAVVEEPYYLNTINYFYPTLYKAGIAMFVAEYTNDSSAAKFASYCPQASKQNTNTALFNINLNASSRVSCN